MEPHYDCVIIGGGIAGLQGAIQLGRYKHKTLVVDKGRGRSVLCKNYRNVLGWPEGISGEELRRIGRLQAERLGVEFEAGEVVRLEKKTEVFRLELKDGRSYTAGTVLLATGLTDRFPELPGLEDCLGLSVFVCPDCDGYETSGRRTIVMGAGNPGANMALMLSYWTGDIVYINHELPLKSVNGEIMEQLQAKGIEYREQQIEEVLHDGDGLLRGVRVAGGLEIAGDRAFIAFGGNRVESDLAAQVSAERLENSHVFADPRSKMTNIPGLWAAGDVGVHAEQLTIAMGEGSQAAIWIHKEIMKQKHSVHA